MDDNKCKNKINSKKKDNRPNENNGDAINSKIEHSFNERITNVSENICNTTASTDTKEDFLIQLD